MKNCACKRTNNKKGTEKSVFLYKIMKKASTCPTIWDNTRITSHSKTNKLINLKNSKRYGNEQKVFHGLRTRFAGLFVVIYVQKLRDDGAYLTRIAINYP